MLPLADLDPGVLRLAILHGRQFLDDLEKMADEREDESLLGSPSSNITELFPIHEEEQADPETRPPWEVHAIVGPKHQFYTLYRESFHRSLTFSEYLDIDGLGEPESGLLFMKDSHPRPINGVSEPQLAMYGRSGNNNSSNTIYSQTMPHKRLFEILGLLQAQFRGKGFTREQLVDVCQERLSPAVRHRSNTPETPQPIQSHFPPNVLRFLSAHGIIGPLPSRGEIFFDCEVVGAGVSAFHMLSPISPDSRVHARRVLALMRKKKKLLGTNGPQE